MTAHEKKSILLEWLAGLVTAVGTYLSPLFGVLAVLLIVACTDHIIGIWRAVKVGEKLEFLKGIKQTISKVLIYTVICLAVHSIDHFLLNEFWSSSFNTKFLLLKGVTLLLCYLELKSINRSYKQVKGVNLMETFYSMIKGARDIVEKIRDIKNGAAVIVLMMLLGSCALVSPEKRHEKLVKKYPFLHLTDTVEQSEPVTFYIDRITKDTIFRDKITQGKTDTIILEKERLKVKYLRSGDTVYLSGECEADTIIKTVKIKVPIKYYPLPGKWWHSPLFIVIFGLGCAGIGMYLTKGNNIREDGTE